MNKLGLLGGTSWHSTILYYQIINQAINDHFGNNTNPPLSIYTLNQHEIHKCQNENNWTGVAKLLIEGAMSLQRGGAEALMFCANTPHKVYQEVSEQVSIPIMHISDATSEAITRQGVKKVCFIGTKFSMSESFVTDRINEHGIEVLVPESEKIRIELHRIIQEELTFGQVLPASKAYVVDIINGMIAKGAGGVVLGCTEFPLMIMPDDLPVPIFNTSEIHAQYGTAYILGS